MTSPVRGGGEAERFLPETHGALMTHEHVHRYALAASLLGGRRVLDVASGAGYGTRLLRAAGAHVVPMDLDAAAARRASSAVRASATALPFADHHFDAVVCFEMIEHVPEPERVADEIARVLATDGVALISTPDRDVYTDRAGNRNPYHLREMTRVEFAALLAGRFAAVSLYGQSVWAGSWIARLDAAGAPPAGPSRRVGVLPLRGEESASRAPWVDPETDAFPTPLYLVAVCGHSHEAVARAVERIGSEQLLHDREQRVVGELQAQAEALVQRDREVASLADHARNVEELQQRATARVASLEQHAANLEQEAAKREARIRELERHATNLEERLAERTADCEGLETYVAHLKSAAEGHEAHAANLEQMAAAREERICELERHAGNLEQLLAAASARCEGLESHVANLESIARGRDAHVANLETLAAGLEAHVSNLEHRLAGLEEHARHLERSLEERRSHAADVQTHVENLERELRERALRIADLELHASNVAAEIQRREDAARDLERRLAGEEARASDAAAAHAAEQERVRERDASLARLRAAFWVRAGRRLGLIE